MSAPVLISSGSKHECRRTSCKILAHMFDRLLQNLDEVQKFHDRLCLRVRSQQDRHGQKCPMSALGQEQTFCTVARMSGLSLKADATEADRHAQFVPKRTFGRFYSITLSAGEPVSMRIPIQHPHLKTLKRGECCALGQRHYSASEHCSRPIPHQDSGGDNVIAPENRDLPRNQSLASRSCSGRCHDRRQK